MEIDPANTAFPAEPGQADTYLTATSCAKLFGGPNPGSSPLCKVLVGPAAPGKVSARVPPDAGTYRLPHVLIDIDIWDESCRTPIG